MQTICISSKHYKDNCKVSKESERNCRRSCAHKAPPFIHFHCQNDRNMTKFKLQTKLIKINLSIISTPHAYLQSLVMTSVKFQKNRNETVGGVAHTRNPLSIHFHCQNARKMTKFKLRKKV